MEIVNGESSAKKEALVIYYKAEAENQNAEAKQECIKGPWSSAEDEMLVELVKKYGPKRWSLISRMLKGRIGKQCRERWHNHLNPNVNKSAWTKEEDLILIQCHQQLGNQWAKIAQFLPGRTDNSIKNRWNSSLKRWQLMKTVDGGASDGEDYTMAYEDGGSSQGSVESQRDESLWGNTFYKHEASSPEQQSPDSTFWDSNSHVFVRLEKENKENQGEDEYVEVVSENEEDRAGACGGGGNVSSTSYSLPETSISNSYPPAPLSNVENLRTPVKLWVKGRQSPKTPTPLKRALAENSPLNFVDETTDQLLEDFQELFEQDPNMSSLLEDDDYLSQFSFLTSTPPNTENETLFEDTGYFSQLSGATSTPPNTQNEILKEDAGYLSQLSGSSSTPPNIQNQPATDRERVMFGMTKDQIDLTRQAYSFLQRKKRTYRRLLMH